MLKIGQSQVGFGVAATAGVFHLCGLHTRNRIRARNQGWHKHPGWQMAMDRRFTRRTGAALANFPHADFWPSVSRWRHATIARQIESWQGTDEGPVRRSEGWSIYLRKSQ
jgi:hypothetical protein